MVARADICTLCPRRCGVERGQGFCHAGKELEVGAVCLHRGEEPPISGEHGIVNIFFAHCNLQCVYCQNHQISSRQSTAPTMSVDQLADRVCQLLPESSGSVGFVTAAHYADRLPNIVAAIEARGQHPTYVYNSSGYESVDTLRRLEGIVDVYLPDYKYADPAVATLLSHAPDYAEVAQAALLEMRRQVGEGLKVADGVAYRGMVVRHLVLPGFVSNSLQCLDWLAENFDTDRLHLSLMAQYFPPKAELPADMNRTLTASEYQTVTDHADALGFECGWQQELSAEQNYRPDFDRSGNPFET